MISRCRAKSWIIQLKETDQVANRTTQRGLKGNIIVYPQKPTALAKVLPPSLEDLTAPICVIFVGSSRPSQEWLRNKAKPLTARPKVVRDALIWLKSHNKWYRDIKIDFDFLASLPDEFVLPVHVECVESGESEDSLTAGYDPARTSSSTPPVIPESSDQYNEEVSFENANATMNELRAAAMRHIKFKGGSYIEIPHDTEPMNEFFNPSLFPMIYPTLFPYGIGGFEDYSRSEPVSLKRHLFLNGLQEVIWFRSGTQLNVQYFN
ncbi:MAG: hypothetical protein NXY57DRAFT_1046398 [Lentinula lateritia]|nr:MAG: hypothetical protein NXY57DRAFT_1046398 [Lentinula lateritia]